MLRPSDLLVILGGGLIDSSGLSGVMVVPWRRSRGGVLRLSVFLGAILSSVELGDLGFFPLSPEITMLVALTGNDEGVVLAKWLSTEAGDAGGFLRLGLAVAVLVRVGFFPGRVLLWCLAAEREPLFLKLLLKRGMIW